jgi:hypothetical protein
MFEAICSCVSAGFVIMTISPSINSQSRASVAFSAISSNSAIVTFRSLSAALAISASSQRTAHHRR